MNRDEVIEMIARRVCAAGDIFQPEGDVWDEGKKRHIKGWEPYIPDAQAALQAIQDAGLAVVPVELLHLSEKAFNGGILSDADFPRARAMLDAAK